MRSKNEILQEAILSQMETGASFDFFTAEDILTVAGIGEKEIEELKRKNQGNIERLLNWRFTDEN